MEQQKKKLVLNREDTVRYHRQMWQVMYELCLQRKIPQKEEAIAAIGMSEYHIGENNCFPCEYAMQQWCANKNNKICYYCPLLWGTSASVTCIDNGRPYDRFMHLYTSATRNSLDDEGWEELTNVCKQIAELPER